MTAKVGSFMYSACRDPATGRLGEINKSFRLLSIPDAFRVARPHRGGEGGDDACIDCLREVDHASPLLVGQDSIEAGRRFLRRLVGLREIRRICPSPAHTHVRGGRVQRRVFAAVCSLGRSAVDTDTRLDSFPSACHRSPTALRSVPAVSMRPRAPARRVARTFRRSLPAFRRCTIGNAHRPSRPAAASRDRLRDRLQATERQMRLLMQYT